MAGILFWGSNTPPAVRVFIFAGQSNNVVLGATSVPVELQASDSNVTIWNIFTQAWQTYVAGTNAYTAASGAGNQFGPEGEFSRLYRNAFPSRKVAIIKYAVPSTPLYPQGGSPDDWAPTSTGEYFDLAKAEIMAALAALGVRYSIDAVLDRKSVV